jgi:CubicO group peptidase (beta-lactamase class C family)
MPHNIQGGENMEIRLMVVLPVVLICLIGCSTINRKIRENQEMFIHGYVADGFEEVKSEFIKNFTKRGEIGTAFSVYYKGEKVIDLWGGYKNDETEELWEEDTLIRTYSTTKGISLIVLGKLHSDGLLDYNEKISTYWPEFGRNGKEDITVEQLITQKSGLVYPDRNVRVSELNNFTEISDLLEDSTPLWEPGEKQGYCAATLGLFEQQLVQRIDKKGRSIGRYFQEEIAAPLNVEFYIGIPDNVDSRRLAKLQMLSLSPLKGMLNFYKPPKGLIKQIMKPSSLLNKAFSVIENDVEDPFEELQYEDPSGGGVGEARALAKIYGILAMGGEELGISPETMKLFIEPAPPAAEGSLDVVMGFESVGSRAGYLKPSKMFDFGSDQAFGFAGTGGSFAFADPEYKIGFAYFMSKMDYYGINDPREAALREALYNCIGNL